MAAVLGLERAVLLLLPNTNLSSTCNVSMVQDMITLPHWINFAYLFGTLVHTKLNFLLAILQHKLIQDWKNQKHPHQKESQIHINKGLQLFGQS